MRDIAQSQAHFYAQTDSAQNCTIWAVMDPLRIQIVGFMRRCQKRAECKTPTHLADLAKVARSTVNRQLNMEKIPKYLPSTETLAALSEVSGEPLFVWDGPARQVAENQPAENTRVGILEHQIAQIMGLLERSGIPIPPELIDGKQCKPRNPK